MTNFFASYPPTVAGQAVPTYANFAAFPSAVTAGNGALAIALDTDILYISNGTIWEVLANPSGLLAIGTIDSQTKSSDGAVASGNTLYMQTGDATHPGLISTGSQTVAGVKTFSSNPIMSSLTASQAVVTDGSKALASLGYATAATASTLVERDGSGNINVVGANVSSLTASQAVVTDGSKNLASLAYATTATASTLAERDSNANLIANSFIANVTSVVSAGGTTVLTSASAQYVYITGTQAQTIQLPNATTLANGSRWEINNNSTVSCSVTNNATTNLKTVVVGANSIFILQDNSTANGTWDIHSYLPSNASSGTNSTSFTGTLSATSSVTGTQLISTVSTGTAPLTVASTTQVANLNSATTSNLNALTTTGDLPYASTTASPSTISRLGIGSTGNVLTVAGGVPTWAAPATSGTVTSVGMTVPSVLSVSPSTITSSGTFAITYSGTALPVANGGTAVTSVTTAPTATSFAGWDANKNLSANSHLQGYTTTATAAATTTLTVGSTFLQYFTGSTTQTVQLPVTSTLVTGQQYRIVNLSSGVVTVQSSGGNTIQAMAANTYLTLTCISTSGTGTSSWDAQYSLTSSTGTVTSVALSVPATSILGVTGSPVTGSGTLGLTTSGTSGGVPYFSSTTQLTSSALLNQFGLLVGGGAGAAPSAITPDASTTKVLVSGGTGANPTWGTVAAASMPALTGDITTSAGAVATTAAATQANITSLSNSSGVAVHGTNTNNNASAGFVGEYVSSTVSSGSPVTSGGSGNYGDVTSISLTAGDWNVTGVVGYGGGTSVTYGAAGISTTTGNSSTGLAEGDNFCYNAGPTASNDTTAFVPEYRISLSGTTTVYLKYRTAFSATPNIFGRISARRVR